MDNATNDKDSSPKSARERLLAAATELFYQEGVQSVGIDRIIEHAGVAKASLYGNFKGKEDLVRAYLESREAARRAAIEANVARHEAPREKLLAVIDAMTPTFSRPGYRGCAFVRASAEMPDDASGREVCVDSRRWTRELLTHLAKDAGAADPEALASQLVLVYDGAAASAGMDRDKNAAARARATAAILIDAACGSAAKGSSKSSKRTTSARAPRGR